MGGRYATQGDCPKQPENPGLVCGKANCDRCGWNPDVEKRRKEKIRGGVLNDHNMAPLPGSSKL